MEEISLNDMLTSGQVSVVVSDQKPRKKNNMGLLGAISYIIGNIIGAGVFITPTEVIKSTNSAGSAMIILTLAGVTSVFGALTYGELGCMISENGADFAYLCRINWTFTAYIFMVSSCLILYPCIVAIQLQTFSSYFLKAIDVSFANPTSKTFTMISIQILLLTIITLINFQSLGKTVSKFNIIASATKLIAPAILILIGAYFLFIKDVPNQWVDTLDKGHYAPLNLVIAFIACLFSFDGWDVVNFGADELKNPKKNLPLAIVLGMMVVSVIIMTLNATFYSILTLDELLHSATVASSYIHKTIPALNLLVPSMICIILIGSLNSTIFAASRFLQSVSERGYLPLFVSCKNDETNSPRLALVIHALFVVIALFYGELDVLLKYSGVAQWCQRAVTTTALLYIRYKGPEYFGLKSTFKTNILIPALFLITCVATIVTIAYEEIHTIYLTTSVLMCSGVVYLFYFDQSWRKPVFIVSFIELFKSIDHILITISRKIFKCTPIQPENNQTQLK